MATIRPRRRRDGKLAYQAEVRIKREGRLVHRESRTFDRRRLATEWATRLEDQLGKPDAIHLGTSVSVVRDRSMPLWEALINSRIDS